MQETHEMWSRRKLIGFIGGFLGVIAVISILSARAMSESDMAELVAQLRSIGERWWAPIALIGAMIVINLTGLPGTPLTLAAGTVWGWFAGAAWMMAAVMIGTAIPYLIARHGAARIQHLFERRFGSVIDRLERQGLVAVMLLRLMHIFPFAAISYGSGLVNVRPRDYFIGTFFGTLPGVLIYTYLADAILEGIVSPGEATGRMLIAGVLVAALVIGTKVLSQRLQK